MAVPPSQPYRRDIDGLRAVAVLAVLLFHGGVPGVAGGFVGVDVFFVISGYLITGLIAGEVGQARFSLARFYARRVRRIVPALAAMLAVSTLLAFAILTPGRLQEFGASAIAAALMVANFYFYAQSGYFAEASDQVPLLHTWSLSAEEQFYLLWPALAAVAVAKGPRAIRAACTGLFGASLAASAWAAQAAPEAGFYLLPTRIWELLLGALAAVGALPVPRGALAASAASVLGLAAIVVACCTFSPATPIPGVAALIPTGGALLIILAGAQQRPWPNRLLGSPPLVAVGLCSYSLYLWHWPLLVFARIYVNRPLTMAEVAAVLAISLLVSALSWRYVEQPFRRRAAAPGAMRAALAGGPAALIGCAALGAGALVLPPWGIGARAPIAKVEEARYRTNPLARACLSYSRQIPPASQCTFGAAPGAAAPSVVVWGDSHANSIVPGIALLAERGGFNGRQITQHSCPPLLGVTFPFNPRCEPFNRSVLEILERDPSVRAVVLSARWGLYADGTRPDVQQRFALADPAVAATPLTSAQLLHRGLAETVRRLRARGIAVLIVADVPEFGFSPVLCISQEMRLERQVARCEVDAAAVRAQLASGDAALRDVARQYPEVEVVWPFDAFCDDGRCSALRDGVVVYFDDDHLNASGAQYLLRPTAAWFRDVLR